MFRLNYNQLYYFYVVATEGSVKAACEKLHLTQPTISGQIKALEESLGFPLFNRKFRRLELNENGQRILKKASRIFLIGEELQQMGPVDGSPPRTEIKIGVVFTLPHQFVYELTSELWRDPTTAVHIVYGSQDLLVKWLDANSIDLILSDNPEVKSEHEYKAINLGGQKIVAAAHPSLRALKENFPKSLNNQRYLAFTKESRLQEDLSYYFSLHNIKPDVIGSVEDAALLGLMMEKQACFSILPFSSVEPCLDLNQVIILGEIPEVFSNRWLITSPMNSHKLTIRKLVNQFTLQKRPYGQGVA